MMSVTGLDDTPDNRDILEKPIPLGRFCQPSDVGNAVAFLASDEAEFITGVQLAVDGGRSISHTIFNRVTSSIQSEWIQSE